MYSLKNKKENFQVVLMQKFITNILPHIVKKKKQDYHNYWRWALHIMILKPSNREQTTK